MPRVLVSRGAGLTVTDSPRWVVCSRTSRHHGLASYSYSVRSCEGGGGASRAAGLRASPSRKSDAAREVSRSNARFILASTRIGSVRCIRYTVGQTYRFKIVRDSTVPLSGPEFTNQYFIYYVRKLPVWVKYIKGPVDLPGIS